MCLARTHRWLKRALRAFRILLVAYLFLRSIDKTETSIQGLRLTLLRLKRHLLQSRASLQALRQRCSLVLTLEQSVLVVRTLLLPEGQAAVFMVFVLEPFSTIREEE